MAAITSTQRTTLNNICPVFKTLSLGTAIGLLQDYIVGDGSNTSPLVLAPTNSGTDNAKGVHIYSANGATTFFKSVDGKRSYLLRVEGYRPSTYAMGAAGVGVDDAAAYIYLRSYAADGAGCQQRALNANVNHRGTTCGSVGNLIGINVSTSTAVAGDAISLTLTCENYGLSNAGYSGCLDCLYTHEGANASGGEFGIRIRNAKKNGSITGAALKIENHSAATTFFKYGIDLSGLAAASGGIATCTADIVLATKDANGLPAGIFTGAANSDGDIVTDVGADTLWADGSLYLSILDGTGNMWQKQNDVWVDIT